MSASQEEQKHGRKVSIEEARELAAQGAFIIWRPEGQEDVALVMYE